MNACGEGPGEVSEAEEGECPEKRDNGRCAATVACTGLLSTLEGVLVTGDPVRRRNSEFKKAGVLWCMTYMSVLIRGSGMHGRGAGEEVAHLLV